MKASMYLFNITIFLILIMFCNCRVIRHRRKTTVEPFSPYKAAFSEQLKKELREHERLVDQLRFIHQIDWNYVNPAKIKETESSSS
ncbi:hypothetical protein PVAND_000532 [Polypedilum vanderplanki]|uniref:Uncharacterized protein n=1 Tax=Polypedilum vanderplanki TaxID=319348 RepID=A0A9J6BKV8_POLVA|nr:hypothetical protein PVAND_000532 [Polypedilum vanderplanki]